MQTIEGLGVSAGIAIGRAVVMENRARDIYRLPMPADEVGAGGRPFRGGGRAVARRGRPHPGPGAGGSGRAPGRDVRRPPPAAVRHRLSAAGARAHPRRAGERRVGGLPLVRGVRRALRARWRTSTSASAGADLQDVVQHLLRRLQGITHHELSEIEGPVVIVADDLTPSEAVRLGRRPGAGLRHRERRPHLPHHDHRPLPQDPRGLRPGRGHRAGHRPGPGDHRRRAGRGDPPPDRRGAGGLPPAHRGAEEPGEGAASRPATCRPRPATASTCS